MMWRVKAWLAGAGVALAALWAALARAKRKGKREAYETVKEADQKRAGDVRRRVDAARGVQPPDIEYRD